MDKQAITALMMQRQRFSVPAETVEEYEALFRLMQPVAPVYFSRPGDPPVLVHRASFDDRLHNDGLRARRALVKGRFQGGTVGYVFADDLELYVAAYRKDIGRLTARQERLLDLLRHEGPLTCGQIKQETGLLVKEIMPDLHKLQEAFLVYEDQVDDDWDRGWYVFEREWDGVDIRRYGHTEAVSKLLLNFIYLNVFATQDGMKSWLRLPARDILEALAALESKGDIVSVAEGFGKGWMGAEDARLLSGGVSFDIQPSVYMLHRADFLVRSQEGLLKARFALPEVLQYLLIDGEFQGAVLGHWRQGPHDVEDVKLTLPEGEKLRRKRGILDAVAEIYSPPFSFIRKYDGIYLETSANDSTAND